MWTYFSEHPITTESIPELGLANSIQTFEKPRTIFWTRTWDERNKYLHVMGWVKYTKRLHPEIVKKYELWEMETEV